MTRRPALRTGGVLGSDDTGAVWTTAGAAAANAAGAAQQQAPMQSQEQCVRC